MDQQLHDMIEKVRGVGLTGTIMAVSKENVMGRVFFVDGEPNTARCAGEEGESAFELISEFAITSLKFHQNTDLVRSKTAINSAAPSANPSPQESSGKAAVAAVSQPLNNPAPTAASDPLPGNTISADDLSQIESLLLEYIGPMAGIIMQDVKPAMSEGELIRVLTADFENVKTADEFTLRVKKVLNS